MNYRNYRYNVQKTNGQRRDFELYLPEGLRVVQPRDEREQGRGRDYAFGLVDDRDGGRRLVMAQGAVPYQHLQELADRARADEPVLTKPGPRLTAADWNAAWQDYIQLKRDREAGRVRYYQSGNRSR